MCKLLIPIPRGFADADMYTNQADVMLNGTKSLALRPLLAYCTIADVTKSTEIFMEVLEKRASELGLRIKACETSTSTDVMIYGKEILYKGAYMTQGLKRISKVLPDTNETFPDFHTRITTLQTVVSLVLKKLLIW
jgi:hypothetical protein